MILFLMVSATWMYATLKKRIYGIAFLLYMATINFQAISLGVDITFGLKILFLINGCILISDRGFQKERFRLLLLFTVVFGVSMINISFSGYYSVYSAFKATMSFVTGIIFVSFCLWEKECQLLLRVLAYRSIACVLIGIVLQIGNFYSFFYSGRLAGANTPTNLAFIAALSVTASIVLYYQQKKLYWIYVMLISFIICCFTLTRGGILFCIIVMLPLIKEFFQRLELKKMLLLMIFLAGGMAVVLTLGNRLMERMFVGGELNTSGRIEAWIYIITNTLNRWYGSGYGRLSTLTDQKIIHFTAAHNEFIRTFYESGIVGVVLMLYIFYSLFRGLLFHSKVPKVILTFVILSFGIYSFVDNTISNYIFWIPYMLLLNIMTTNAGVLRFKVKKNE